jgi:hypothetical protein
MGNKTCLTSNGKEYCSYFKPNAETFSTAVRKILSLRAETTDEKITRYAKDLCSLIIARVDAVKDADAFNTKNDHECLSEPEYNLNSTTSRDKRIFETTQNFMNIASTKYFYNSKSELLKHTESMFPSCAVLNIAPGVNLPISEYLTSVARSETSDNPNETLLARWGLESTKSSCKTY